MRPRRGASLRVLRRLVRASSTADQLTVARRVANVLCGGFTDSWSGQLEYCFIEDSYERAWQHFRKPPASARVSLRTATEMRMRFQTQHRFVQTDGSVSMRLYTAIITPDLDCAEGVIIWRAD